MPFPLTVWCPMLIHPEFRRAAYGMLLMLLFRVGLAGEAGTDLTQLLGPDIRTDVWLDGIRQNRLNSTILIFKNDRCGLGCIEMRLSRQKVVSYREMHRLSFQWKKRLYTVMDNVPGMNGSIGVMATEQSAPQSAMPLPFEVAASTVLFDMETGGAGERSRTQLFSVRSMAEFRELLATATRKGYFPVRLGSDRSFRLERQDDRLFLQIDDTGRTCSVLVTRMMD